MIVAHDQVIINSFCSVYHMNKLRSLTNIATPSFAADRRSCIKVMVVLLVVSIAAAATFLSLFIVTKAKVDQLESQESCKVSDVCDTRDCAETAGAMISRIDFDVDPCDDFYQYTMWFMATGRAS